MSACEWCWYLATRRSMFCGGSTTDRYHEVLEEQNTLGPRADCPEARANEERKMAGVHPTNWNQG